MIEMSSDKRRFTLNLPSSTIEALEAVRDDRGFSALADVLREATEVYLALLDGRDKGLELYFRDSSNGKEGPIWLLPGPPPETKKGQ